MDTINSRTMSTRRARWERRSGPVRCWLGNRWNWRKNRRLRADMQQWKRLTVPLDQLEPDDDPDVQRIAEFAATLGSSVVLAADALARLRNCYPASRGSTALKGDQSRAGLISEARSGVSIDVSVVGELNHRLVGEIGRNNVRSVEHDQLGVESRLE